MMKKYFCVFTPWGRGMDMSGYRKTSQIEASSGPSAIRKFVKETGYGHVLKQSNIGEVEEGPDTDTWYLVYDGDTWEASIIY
jgi:hypothetical protein